MAVTSMVRFTPDTLDDHTKVANAESDGSSGTVFFPIQVIVYDDAKVIIGGASNNYKPGHPDTESLVTIVHQDVIQGDLSVLNAMTNAQKNTWADGQLDAWAQANKGLINAVGTIRYLSLRRPPRPIA